MSAMLEKISNLEAGETCYPLDRADISVTLSNGPHPFHLLDNHGYEYYFDTAAHCAQWIDGDRENIIEWVHVVWDEDELQVHSLPWDEEEVAFLSELKNALTLPTDNTPIPF